MNWKKASTSGFSAIEAVLIVVILAIIGSTGYYVYHSNKKTDDTLKTTSAQSTDNQPNGGKGGGVTGDKHPQTGPAKNEVMIIHEWGLASEFPAPPKQAALIQHQIASGSKPQMAQFTTQELIDSNPACSLDRAPAGIIARATATDPFYLPDGTPSGKTVQQQLTSNANTLKPYKKVGSYYYWYISPPAACGTSQQTRQLQTVAEAQVKQIVLHLEKE